MDGIENDTNLMKMVSELIHLQATYSKTSMAEKIRGMKEIAEKKVQDIQEYIRNQADIYNINQKEDFNIGNEYHEKMQLIRNDYYSYMSELQANKLAIEEEGLKKIIEVTQIKKEIKEIKKTDHYKKWKKYYDSKVKEAKVIGKSGNVEEYMKALDEIRRIEKMSPTYEKENNVKSIVNGDLKKIWEEDKKIENEQADLKEEAKQAVERATGEKETALTNIKKQNIFQRFIGKMTNQFRKGKKFEKNVINVLKDDLETFINTTVPNFREAAGGIVKKSTQKVHDLGITVIDKSVNGISALIQMGIDAKNDIMKDIKDKVEGKSNDLRGKIEQLNQNKHKDDGPELQ